MIFIDKTEFEDEYIQGGYFEGMSENEIIKKRRNE